ncbi:hypothetical protein HIM_05244 [Hirsutella minnesotensis 3608]|uniref:Carrier domain-containing protein n=1 Tax=Hirsutella minnesotensis 3608 TaxID=1043627 RepID=A0A0F7ZUR4_9HYPO|nr:hypothetical protein HIM_05244 [Hirsutella minnesotensis 3608]
MTTPDDVHICLFKPSRSDVVTEDRFISAHLDITNLKSFENFQAPIKSLLLTGWALLLKNYLATHLISFASSHPHEDEPAALAESDCENVREHGGYRELIHSLEVADYDSISEIVRRIHQPATQRTLDQTLLSFVNTMIFFHQVPITNSDAANLDVVPEMEQIDICIAVNELHNLLSLDIRLRASKFSHPLAHRLLGTYHHILNLISMGHPGLTVGDVDPLTEQDRHQICNWNTKIPVRREACLHSVFEEHARSRPQAPAVCSWDGEMSYAELNALSTNLAHKLAQLGVGPEVMVPYAFEKSVYAVVATLAVLKAGGAFVPLDVSHPRDRCQSIVSRVEAKLILASAKTAPSLAWLPNVLIIDRVLLDSLPEQYHNPCSGVGPANSAFVLFTSGSTGEPKGLVQEHASVCTVNEAYGHNLFLTQESRVLNFAAYTFDVSTVDIFATLYHGGCVCIPSEEDRLNDVVRVINDFRVNWVDLTPSFAMASMPRPGDMPTLKTLVLAGEEVKREHVAHFTGTIERVINCYGPAEAGGCLASVYQDATSQPQTVGIALTSASCWIVDPGQGDRLAPIGAVGELIVEGPTLAREYLKDPCKTARAFVRHPGWRVSDGQQVLSRFYRTGDLVSYRPDGLIDYIGRRDTQVKIRGQRVELTEIEQHLAANETIKRCVVEFPESGVYGKSLVGVIEPHLGKGQRESSADSFLQLVPNHLMLENGFSIDASIKTLTNKIPVYMMPAAWLVVNTLPLTDSKKVDRRKVRAWLAGLSVLQEPVLSGSVANADRIPPVNALAVELSQKVGEIIANGNTLKFSALNGRNFGLVAAGLDSIQVMTLSRWIRDQYGLKITANLLTRPSFTIQELARVVTALKNGHEQEKFQCRLDILDEVDVLSKRLSRPASIMDEDSNISRTVSTVFLTGGTGFLGIEIMRQLLVEHAVKTVIVLVRAKNVQHGKARLTAAASRAGWWAPSFSDRIEIWPGDLSRTNLGLSDQHWRRLAGHSSSGEPVDVIIHNGAEVRWNLAYDSLKASNTMSTLHLLETMIERRPGGRFLYVSGGQSLSTKAEDEEGEEAVAAQGAHRTGYAQSKMISELLVRRFARSERGRNHIIRVVKPSYIIGDARSGMANQSDYLWGYTKSAIELRTYSRDTMNGWLFISDITAVASTICQICETDLYPASPTVVKVLDGVAMQDFWHVLEHEFGYELKAVDGHAWWRSLQSHVEQAGSEHCLWALQDILDADLGEIASTETVPSAAMVASSPAVLRAVRRNVRYLRDHVQFLPPMPSRDHAARRASSGGWVEAVIEHWHKWVAFITRLLFRTEPTPES